MQPVTTAQLCLVIAILYLALAGGFWLTTLRLNDVRDLLRAEIQASRTQSKADFAELRAEVRGMRGLIDAIMGKLDELDRRMSRGI